MIRFARTFSLPALAVLALASPGWAQGAKDANTQNGKNANAQSVKDVNAQFDKVLPQKVLEDDAVPVTSNPVVQPVVPPQPLVPVVQQWGVADAQKLLLAIRAIASEGLDPLD